MNALDYFVVVGVPVVLILLLVVAGTIYSGTNKIAQLLEEIRDKLNKAEKAE